MEIKDIFTKPVSQMTDEELREAIEAVHESRVRANRVVKSIEPERDKGRFSSNFDKALKELLEKRGIVIGKEEDDV
ncbi:MAG: hypothetical protein QXG97_05575 [Nitrososphaerota archaeon]